MEFEVHDEMKAALTKLYSYPPQSFHAIAIRAPLPLGLRRMTRKAKSMNCKTFSAETQEAERAALEVEVIRIEAEAIQDAVLLTSDNEGGDESPDFEQGGRNANPNGASFQTSAAVRLW
ncbi:MAG: hypothetical protein LQ341_005583 [Variospora aurantia]|nr:MAG: hypothetical protein LQ341_005583 [Variospora aurantia]